MSLIQGDARALPLIDGCVQCCVTSPPYWGLRAYPDARQIGLEATPDAYVATMVAVFAEVWRVLRDDGTCWLNLGDSYAGGGGYAPDAPCNQRRAAGDSWGAMHPFTGAQGQARAKAQPGYVPAGLKPKDLVGIPWSVAKALQAPRYHGTIPNREDRIWLAAMLDAEGCLFIHKRKTGQSNGQGYQRQNDNFGPGLEIANTSLRVIERCKEIAGVGSICAQDGGRKQRLYRWNVRTTQSRDLVRELYPHLVAKQQQARILYGCPSNGERAEAAHAALMSLHRTGESGVDFPAPASLFSPGWYLRSDIIWSKCNPMPESVTDRPTKSHEYIFLLSKSARYLYEADAIAERSIDPESLRGRNRRNDDKFALHDPNGKARTRAGFAHIKAGTVYAVRNRRSVWTVATQPFSGAHFATFPEALIEPCILAGSRPGDLVLDPFIGSGTVGAVCERFGRRWVGTDLSYQGLSTERTAQRGLRFDEDSRAAGG